MDRRRNRFAGGRGKKGTAPVWVERSDVCLNEVDPPSLVRILRSHFLRKIERKSENRKVPCFSPFADRIERHPQEF